MSSPAKLRRILQLLERLQSGRPYNTADLADFCQVSRRTVFRDLKVLQDSGVPVLYDTVRQGYWVAGGTYLPPTDFTVDETLALLMLAQDAGQSPRSIPFLETARDAALKLLSNLPGDLRQHLGEVLETIQIRTEPQARANGKQPHYQRVLKALRERCKIRLKYNSFAERAEITTLVSPYRLLFQRRSWYVIGRSSLHRAVRTFHIGRIIESEITSDPYTIPARFSLKRQLGQAWNLIREPKARTRVVVRFRPLVAHNVAEVSWHCTQQIRWNADGSLDFEVEVDGLKEIVWWVLGYGKQAEVLEPPALREMVCEHLREQAIQYGLLPASS